MFDLFISARPIRMVLALGGMSVLSACGGGGGGASDTPMVQKPVLPSVPIPDIPDRPDLPDTGTAADLRDQGTVLLAQYAGVSTVNYTAISDLPMTGTSRYEGYFYGDLSQNGAISDTMIGDMTMNVGWTAQSVTLSGNVSDVLLADDTALAGTLMISGGSLNRQGNPNSDFTLGGQLDGTLSAAGKSYAFGNNPIEGDFIGNTHNAAGGEVLGKVRVNGQDQLFDGGFIVER